MSMRKVSRINYTTKNPDVGTITEIQLGCLQRIADATEVMSQNHNHLIDSNEYLKKSHKEHLARIKQLERSNAALRGVITKMKKKNNL